MTSLPFHTRPLARPILSLLLAAGLAGSPALAQDSVSKNADAGNGLPGDALSPFTASLQRTSYVVDLVPLQTSWGTTFALGPILKCGRVTPARFNSLSGPSAISASLRPNAPYPSPSYTRWTQPQGGLDPTNNTVALNSTLTPTGVASVFGVALLEYSDAQVGSTLAFFNDIIGCQVAFDPASPARLFVTRVVAACNSSDGVALDRSQFGLGSIDADGNVHFRADSTTASSLTSLIAGDNYFRVRLPQRTNAVNLIDVSGASNAVSSTRLLNNGAVTTNTPSAIPADLASRPVLVGANLAGQLIAETSANTLTTTTSHLGSAVDHRGAPSFSAATLFAGSIGTGAMLVRSAVAPRNDAISIFGLDSSGLVVASRQITIPASIVDACTATPWPSGEALANADFRHYESQATFRGGNGPVAVTKDAAGNALVAAVAYSHQNNSTPANPHDAILVARFDPDSPTSPVSWATAAWSATPINDGKDILGDFGTDGIPNTSDPGERDGTLDAAPIGRIASLSELAFGKDGPSLSAPMMDAAGNVWFTASVALNTLIGNLPATEYTTALVRAVYDAGTFCYRLELVVKLGDTFVGANSATPYRIAYLGLADADSIASEAPWSGSIAGVAWNNASLAGLEPRNPKSLGGLVLSSRIVYDVDADADFEDPTRAGGNAASTDEGYDVVLFLGNIDNSAACPADLDNDGDLANGPAPDGAVDINDLLYFFAAFEEGLVAVDLDNDGDPAVGTPDGGVDINDLLFFLARFEAGC